MSFSGKDNIASKHHLLLLLFPILNRKKKNQRLWADSDLPVKIPGLHNMTHQCKIQMTRPICSSGKIFMLSIYSLPDDIIVLLDSSFSEWSPHTVCWITSFTKKWHCCLEWIPIKNRMNSLSSIWNSGLLLYKVTIYANFFPLLHILQEVSQFASDKLSHKHWIMESQGAWPLLRTTQWFFPPLHIYEGPGMKIIIL